MGIFGLRAIRAVAFLVGGIATLCAFYSHHISTWQLQNAPLEPDFDNGALNSVFMRGVTIYLDDVDYAVEKLFFPVSCIVGLLAAGLVQWAGRRLRALEPQEGVIPPYSGSP